MPAKAGIKGPADCWCNYAIRGSEIYPGGTVEFFVSIIDAGPDPIMLDEIIIKTPWRTYIDYGLPVIFKQGGGYTVYINITIPTNQNTGITEWVISVSARYWDGQSWLSYNPLIQPINVTILPNPYQLQEQVNSLQMERDSFMKQLNDTKIELSTAQSLLISTQDQLDDVQAELSSTQAQLSSYSTYLTLGIAVPTLAALAMAILYFHKKPPTSITPHPNPK